MKYWRGYLTAAILAAIAWGLNHLASKYTNLVDMVYPYLTRTVQNFLADWTGGVDFCVWQVILVLLILFVLATIVLMIVLRWNPVQWLGWVLAGVSLIYCMHTCVYGLNYHAGALATDIRLESFDWTLDELEDATVYYRDLANSLADEVKRDENGDVDFPSFEAMAEQAGEGFKSLTYDHSYSVFAGSTVPVKELSWADLYSSMGVTGITMGLTGEAAVNPQTPDVGLPFTMCHEMAHRMCIAIERDANFAAFLACINNSSKEFQYSGYFMAFRYCYSALASLSSSKATTAAVRIAADVNENFQHDLDSYTQFFSDKKDENATWLADTANDAYLKASGDENGITSYGEVYGMLVSWHIQEVVLPAQLEEAESVFDPYDESQVDLSGIVGAIKKDKG